ncbi:NUDIX domain-containing protein [Streptomyces sp. 35G-GA-8]|uniref:NUDIX hydrolase n=1 Tax=Streptomyces sp. 35G-GA-8 TaxID=2939434 RepID=UPI00201F2072|nr:NUDIX domain-containing protein [Streptomyces sp. 35G-GA-8]MCL7378351.1 NUDIX domain-containing protein [Streptomyces sp. 35G-GA-8]
MALTRSHIRTTAEAYLARHPHERESLAGLMSLLDGADDTTARATLSGHVTCSAAVIGREQRVLHIGHRVAGPLLDPGGRVEGDRTLLAAALREVCEKTGLRPRDLCLTPQFLGAPIDIDVHDIDANPAKGESVHQRFDFRFVFYLVPERHPRLASQDEEVADARWLKFADVRSPTLRTKLMDARDQGLGGRPEPVNASALIHDGHGRYLLHLRDQREGIWTPGTFALLGGGRTPDDISLEATLRRELAEEATGLELDGLTPYALEEATSVDGFAVPIQVFEARWSGDPETVDLQEGVLLRWFTPDTMERLNLSPGLGDLIRRHAAEHPPAGTPPISARLLRNEAPEGTELHIVGVHLYLEDTHGRILLGLRHPDSPYAGNTWHFLAGHCEREEAVSCLVREAQEEAGLIIDPGDVELVHLVHVVDSPSARPRIGLVLRARTWSGTPAVLEPDRCVEWRWWNPKNLPAAVVPYTRQAIEEVLAGRLYSQTGWDRR